LIRIIILSLPVKVNFVDLLPNILDEYLDCAQLVDSQLSYDI